MKRKLFFGLVLTFICGAVAIYVLAQQPAPPASSNKLANAVALIQADRPAEAKELLAAIGPDDAAFAAAQRYLALCLHELKDYHGFMKAMSSFDIRATVVPPEIREILAYEQIDGLFYFRKFEDIFPAIQAFQTEYPASACLSTVTEYHLAALFERGLKKTLEASRLKDETQFNRRWTEGKANLEQFLSLAASYPVTNYSVLPKRSLRYDLWAARIILGDGTAALEEIPGQDAASREKFSLLRALLYPKIQPGNAGENLQRMSDFLEEFPESRSRPRMEFEMADVALCEGERLAQQAEAASRAGDAETATAKRDSAAPYLNRAHELFSRVDEDQEAGIVEADVRESRVGMLRVFFAQEDWPSLAKWKDQLIANSPGEKGRLVAKLYYGVGLVRQGKLTEAAGELDEVLAIGFRNTPSYDGLLVSAAEWRIHVARLTGDEASARRVAQQVQSSDCVNSLKRTFLKQFGILIAQPDRISQ